MRSLGFGRSSSSPSWDIDLTLTNLATTTHDSPISYIAFLLHEVLNFIPKETQMMEVQNQQLKRIKNQQKEISVRVATTLENQWWASPLHHRHYKATKTHRAIHSPRRHKSLDHSLLSKLKDRSPPHCRKSAEYSSHRHKSPYNSPFPHKIENQFHHQQRRTTSSDTPP